MFKVKLKVSTSITDLLETHVFTDDEIEDRLSKFIDYIKDREFELLIDVDSAGTLDYITIDDYVIVKDELILLTNGKVNE